MISRHSLNLKEALYGWLFNNYLPGNTFLMDPSIQQYYQWPEAYLIEIKEALVFSF